MTQEEKIVQFLDDNKMSVATAESCTGGLVCSKIVDVPGASNVLNESFITYSNKAKVKLLGVKRSTLKKYGAVSKKCAKQMAEGAAKAAKSDAAISVTGIAGPGGGTDEKPVGLVFIGCFVKGKCKVKKFLFDGDRRQVRERSAEEALNLLYKCLKKSSDRKGEK